MNIVGIKSNKVPYGWPESRQRDVSGYILDNGLVLLESERDIDGRYRAGVGMNGMYLQIGRLFEPICDADDIVIGFREYALKRGDRNGNI